MKLQFKMMLDMMVAGYINIVTIHHSLCHQVLPDFSR
jgi:hypothetical protein